MRCPSCAAEVEEGAELCLECGEPMGEAATADSGALAGDAGAARSATPPAPTTNATTSARPPTANATTGAPATTNETTGARPAVRARPRRDEEPEPIRCRGCGTKTLAMRCPSCGTRLRSDDD